MKLLLVARHEVAGEMGRRHVLARHSIPQSHSTTASTTDPTSAAFTSDRRNDDARQDVCNGLECAHPAEPSQPTAAEEKVAFLGTWSNLFNTGYAPGSTQAVHFQN